MKRLNGKGKKWDSRAYKWFYHCSGSGNAGGSHCLLQALCPSDQLREGRSTGSLPSSAMTVSVTVTPASLISWTMLSWDNSTMDCPFTAEIWSPTFSFPQRSAGLPSMTRPILWGITMGKKIPRFFNYLTYLGVLDLSSSSSKIQRSNVKENSLKIYQKTTTRDHPIQMQLFSYYLPLFVHRHRYSLHSCNHSI